MIVSLLAGFAGTLGLARLGVLVALHIVPSSYSPIRNAVSDYAVGPTRPLAATMGWLGAATWLVLGVATWVALPGWSYRGPATAILIGLAVIFAVLPAVPTDLEGDRLTVRGALHYLLAVAWFGLAFSLAGDFSRLWADLPVLGPTLVVLHGVALVSLAALVVALVVRPLRSIAFGLSERVFLVTINLFYLGVAVGLGVSGTRG